MRLIVLPGVFRPISDTRMLADSVRAHLGDGQRALDLCTGSGAIALAAASAGARTAASDVSRAAVLNVRINARLNGVRVDVRRGDLLEPFAGEQFDLIASNPPYVPGRTDRLPTGGPERAWDAGLDGRALLDRICAEAPAYLRPGGTLLLVHSSLIDGGATLERLGQAGLRAEIVERVPGPLGPLMAARAPQLEARGLLPAGRREEELLVIRGVADEP